VLSPLIFWPWFAGFVILVTGLFAARKSFAAAEGLEKIIVFGPIFFSAPLAAFGAEHLSNSRAICQAVPLWMPARMFWTYFVGFALISAAASIALRIHARISAMLLGIMFICFVLMIHIPNVAATPKDRIVWAVAFRDLAFAGGAFALAATLMKPLRTLAIVLVAVPLLFFAVEHFLHPEFAPGVPLPKVTPAWVPIRVFWGYLTGAGLLVSGATMLRYRRRARLAATLLGALIALLVLFLYLPIFLTAAQPALLEGINYVADTLLFAGAVLLAAAIMPGVCQPTSSFPLTHSATRPADPAAKPAEPEYRTPPWRLARV
jgi:uncharacterized membrane protein YphA (DoxX/SURF4 family)